MNCLTMPTAISRKFDLRSPGNQTSLAVLGPAIVVLAVLLFAANAALTRAAPVRARSAADR